MRDLKQELERLMKLKNWSQNKVATMLPYSNGYLSRYMSGNFTTGNIEKFEKVLQEFIDREIDKIETKSAVIPFVETANTKVFNEIAALCLKDCEIGVCCGEPGAGKSRSAKQFVEKHPGTILLEVDLGYTTKIVFREIHKKLGLSGEGGIHDMLEDIIKELKGSERLIIIDEAEHLPYRALELIRRIWDKTLSESYQGTVGILLVGLPRLKENLKGRTNEYAQLFQRVGWYRKLKKMSDRDITMIVDSVFPDSNGLWKSFRKFSGNNARVLTKLIMRSQRVAQINNCVVDEEIISSTAETLIM